MVTWATATWCPAGLTPRLATSTPTTEGTTCPTPVRSDNSCPTTPTSSQFIHRFGINSSSINILSLLFISILYNADLDRIVNVKATYSRLSFDTHCLWSGELQLEREFLLLFFFSVPQPLFYTTLLYTFEQDGIQQKILGGRVQNELQYNFDH